MKTKPKATKVESEQPSLLLPNQFKIILEINLYELLYKYYFIQYKYKESENMCSNILERIDNYVELDILTLPDKFEYIPKLEEYGGFDYLHISNKLKQCECLIYMNKHDLAYKLLNDLESYCLLSNDMYYERYLHYLQYLVLIKNGEIDKAKEKINKSIQIVYLIY